LFDLKNQSGRLDFGYSEAHNLMKLEMIIDEMRVPERWMDLVRRGMILVYETKSGDADKHRIVGLSP
jgi:hypothetical protein